MAGLNGRRIQYPDRLFRVRLSELLPSEFVEFSFRHQLLRTGLENSAKSSVGHQRISLSDLRSFRLPIPPAEEQSVISEALSSALGSATSIAIDVSESESELTQLDQSILAKAFRGELVPQDPNDEPASALLDRIRMTRDDAQRAGKKSKVRKPRSRSRKK